MNEKTYLEMEYEDYRRRQRTRMQRMRRAAHRQRIMAALAVALAVLLLALCWAQDAFAARGDVQPLPDASVDYTAAQTPLSPCLLVDIEKPLPVETAMEEPPDYHRGDIPLDYDTQTALMAACEESGIEYALALAVIRKETDFRNIPGDGGSSIGYMQVQPKWHYDRMERLGVTDLTDPAGNFRVGCDFLAELLRKYPLAYALTAYNRGSPGLSQYAEDVMTYLEEYRA